MKEAEEVKIPDIPVVTVEVENIFYHRVYMSLKFKI